MGDWAGWRVSSFDEWICLRDRKVGKGLYQFRRGEDLDFCRRRSSHGGCGCRFSWCRVGGLLPNVGKVLVAVSFINTGIQLHKS
jgi:hypothetical protein